MPESAKLSIGDRTLEMPIVTGSENEQGVDTSALRKETGFITLDEGFVNTGSTRSAITYLDGEAGILRYRGYLDNGHQLILYLRYFLPIIRYFF